MPTPIEILERLTHLARAAQPVALFWHVMVMLGAVLLGVTRWRLSKRVAASLAIMPLATASALAFGFGVPFNGVMLGVGAVVLAAIGLRLKAREPVTWAAPWAKGLGGAAVLYALAYPHFIELESWLSLWFAPVGVVPCPTLALVIGVGLMADGFGSRAWSFTAGGLGLFYAVFGIVRLGVWLDVGLLIAAAALCARGFTVSSGARSVGSSVSTRTTGGLTPRHARGGTP